ERELGDIEFGLAEGAREELLRPQQLAAQVPAGHADPPVRQRQRPVVVPEGDGKRLAHQVLTTRPSGSSKRSLRTVARCASTSFEWITSAYFASRSRRLMACEASERSKQPSSTMVTRKLLLNASVTVARTQPLVETPATINVSTLRWMR